MHEKLKLQKVTTVSKRGNREITREKSIKVYDTHTKRAKATKQSNRAKLVEKNQASEFGTGFSKTNMAKRKGK